MSPEPVVIASEDRILLIVAFNQTVITRELTYQEAWKLRARLLTEMEKVMEFTCAARDGDFSHSSVTSDQP